MMPLGSTATQTETVLVIAKTYPLPSKKYQETSCVAGICRKGQLRRIYPVPFRLLSGDKQFTRWQWVSASFYPSPKDKRPESRRIDADSIALGAKIGTQKGWQERLSYITPHLVPCFSDLEARRKNTGETLGFLQPTQMLGLDITPLPASEREWSEKDRANLTQDFPQSELFEENAALSRRVLEKIPYNFHYRYQIQTSGGLETLRHPITDWEISQLYRNCRQSHGDTWEVPFRAKMETDFFTRSLTFMMGNYHRFPHQWLIIGLIYPPRQASNTTPQIGLDL